MLEVILTSKQESKKKPGFIINSTISIDLISIKGVDTNINIIVKSRILAALSEVRSNDAE